jgi:hypothetical protein
LFIHVDPILPTDAVFCLLSNNVNSFICLLTGSSI